MPTNDAELAAACAALPPTERAKLDWTAEVDDEDAAKSASALSEAFVAAQKDLTVTQRRAAFSTLVREVVLEGDMAFDGAPLRLLEALARGLADKGKYKRENGRDAVSGLITLLRRSPDYAPSTKDDARAFAGHAWDAAAFQGLIQQGTSDALAVVARAALMSKPAAAKLIDGGASTEAVRACVGGDANGALAAAALVERGAPVSDALAAMAAVRAHEGDAWALAAATLAAAFARRAPADGEWPAARVAARAAAASNAAPAGLVAPRSCASVVGEARWPKPTPRTSWPNALWPATILRPWRPSAARRTRRRPRGATTRGPSRRWRDVQRRWRRF